MDTLAHRIVRAITLEARLYEEVEADPGALSQAAAVVILSSVAAGIGTLGPGIGLAGLFWGTVATLIGWVAWAFLIYFVGAKLLPEPQTHSDLGELLRVLGFSSAPGLFRIFGVFPALRTPAMVIASLWMLAAMVVAVRQALDYTHTPRAIAVCAVGWLIQWMLIVTILWMSGLLTVPPAPPHYPLAPGPHATSLGR